MKTICIIVFTLVLPSCASEMDGKALVNGLDQMKAVNNRGLEAWKAMTDRSVGDAGTKAVVLQGIADLRYQMERLHSGMVLTVAKFLDVDPNVFLNEAIRFAEERGFIPPTAPPTTSTPSQ